MHYDFFRTSKRQFLNPLFRLILQVATQMLIITNIMVSLIGGLLSAPHTRNPWVRIQALGLGFRKAPICFGKFELTASMGALTTGTIASR
jgi:hypothetical protein